ncbi:hypothetical protein AVEN_226061-1 [Araneus ventricosus]|uniref:Peptidase A2 domain-containing protein n=1 Tax=Araneus ventricosus TaxID=182803 RepID=A0A4Y2IJ29_ARAVE|nr:hypothetical protein AVEN_226061-1 [Araneus ventricosus]
MLVDTGANVTLVRTDLVQKLKENFIYTAPISLQTATDLEKNEIRTGGEEIPFFSASVEHSKLCSVSAKEKTFIIARSDCFIQGVSEVSEKFSYAVTDFPVPISQKCVLVAATLVDLKREVIPVRILNLDNKPKTIDKGAVIATRVRQWWIPLLVLKNFPNHYVSRQFCGILKGLMKNIEQQ